MNREQWLERATELCRAHFLNRGGHKLPTDVKVTCGWPHKGGTGTSKKRIGECWSRAASSAGVNEVFISPYLSDPKEVLSTLVHEHVHVVDDCKSGHKGYFKTCALEVGLEGKMTSAGAGPELMAIFDGWLADLGPYPHATLDLSKSPTKKQSTRMVKCECGACGFIVRTTRKWLNEVGEPHCPKHGRMHADIGAEDGGDE